MEVQQSLRVAELKEANVKLCAELAAANTKVASARILMICKLGMLPSCKRKRIWRRRSARRHIDFRICYARNWVSFDAIQRTRWLHSGGGGVMHGFSCYECHHLHPA
jgi:hypothetical protein